MDQDVEAILNASDSEEDGELNVQGVSLEDILREDDGGYNDDDLLDHDRRNHHANENAPHLPRLAIRSTRCLRHTRIVSYRSGTQQ